jgi:hypothetical protein
MISGAGTRIYLEIRNEQISRMMQLTAIYYHEIEEGIKAGI